MVINIEAVEYILKLQRESEEDFELSSLTEQIHLIFPELPMVSYVIILGEGIWKEGEKVHFTTKSRSVHNPHSIKSLPPSIEEVTKFMKSANQKSLLED